MLIPFVFEEVCNTATASVTRAKVPGGWLVTIIVSTRGGTPVTTTFISDPEWSWSLAE